MRIVAYSSGAWPCGIADYHGKLAEGLAAAGIECHTLPLPTDTVYRDRPLALLRRRRAYQQLAAQSRRYDASLLQLITHWNGARPVEHTLPTFINHLRGPLLMVAHEWPPGLDPESDAKSLPRRAVSRAMSMASRLVERSGLSYDDWLRDGLFARAAHIFVHSHALRERIVALGVPADRVTFQIQPVPQLPEQEALPGSDPRLQQHADRRRIVIFGFPHPRKALDLAIQALPALPADVALLFIGGIAGEFRQQYVRKLQDLARELGVLDRVTFAGEVPEHELRGAFAAAQFALAPFAYATGSSSFSYLMSAGVPIAASDLPEHHALAAEGAGLMLFERGSVSALTAAVKALLDDAPRRRELAVMNRAFALRHTYTRFAEVVAGRLQLAAGHRAATAA